MTEKLTDQQRRAVHKYLRLVAQDMNDAGYSDLTHFLTKPCEIPITMENLKAIVWKPVQKAMLGRESTEKLSKLEVDIVYQVISRHLSENYDITTPFPTED